MVVARRHIRVAPPKVRIDKKLFKKLCEDNGTNATQLAEDCGLDRNTIGRWLKGANPSLFASYAVAKELGVDVTQLWPVNGSQQ